MSDLQCSIWVVFYGCVKYKLYTEGNHVYFKYTCYSHWPSEMTLVEENTTHHIQLYLKYIFGADNAPQLGF